MALSAARNTKRLDGDVTPETFERIVRNGVTVYQGGMVVADSSGHLVPAGNANGITQVLGRCEDTVTGDGTKTAAFKAGVFWYTNSGSSISAANLFAHCYAVDDESVHLGDNAGARYRAGIIVDVDATMGVAVLMTPYLFSDSVKIQRRAATITSDALTTAGVGPESENIGAVLPATAIVLAYRIRLNDAFDNGAGVSLAMEVGNTSDVDALEDGFNCFTGSPKEAAGWSYTTPGPGIGVPSLATQLVATFTAGGDTLANFTNGSVDIEVFYISPASYL